jgi:outer membrane protein OmpA-like peptidoglycan-associated protein
MTLCIDTRTRIAAAAIMALGLVAAAPHWAAAQGGPGGQDSCKLWSKLEAAAKAVDIKAAIAAEREIYGEPDCNQMAVAAKKGVLDLYRVQDAHMEKAKATPKERLAQLEAALKFANKWNAWDIHAKIADLQRKVPGKLDHAKISMAYDRALVAVDEAPKSLRPGKDQIARLARLAYQFEALADTPLKRDGAYTREARQVNVGYVPAPLQFEYDKAELTLAGKAQAQILLAQLKAQKMPVLELIGHTDPVGSFEYNDDLSLRRAAAIKKFLVDNGYPDNRLTIKGRGKRDAGKLNIEDRESFTVDQVHQMLRRVELKFKD